MRDGTRVKQHHRWVESKRVNRSVRKHKAQREGGVTGDGLNRFSRKKPYQRHQPPAWWWKEPFTRKIKRSRAETSQDRLHCAQQTGHPPTHSHGTCHHTFFRDSLLVDAGELCPRQLLEGLRKLNKEATEMPPQTGTRSNETGEPLQASLVLRPHNTREMSNTQATGKNTAVCEFLKAIWVNHRSEKKE